MISSKQTAPAGLLLAVALLFGALATSALAQNAKTTILLKDGTAVTCTPISADGNTLTIRRFDDGQTQTLRYAELHPRTVYRIMKGRTKKTDAVGQMKVAEWCLDQGFFDHARKHYRLAVAADEKLGNKIEGDLEKLRHRGATKILAWSREQLAGGDAVKAEYYLGLISTKFPDTPMAEEASTLLAEIAARSQQARVEKIEASTPRPEDEFMKKLEPGRKRYKKAHDLVNKGLQQVKSQTKAIHLFEQAIGEFQRARKVLDRVAKDEGDDSPLKGQIDSYYEAVDKDIKDTMLLKASKYFTRGSLNDALVTTNEVIALDRTYQPALAMRARLEVSINDDDNRRRGRAR